MNIPSHIKELKALGLFTKFGLTHVARSLSIQAIPYDTATNIIFDTIISDDPGAYSAGTPDRITPPAWATHCRVYMHMEWEIDATGYRSARINYGGLPAALPQCSPTVVQAPNGTISDHNCGVTGVFPITTDEYMEMKVRHNITSTGTLDALTSNTQVIVEWYG